MNTGAALRIVFLLCAVSLSSCVCGGCRGRMSRHLDRANKYYEGKKYNEAIVEYMNVLRMNPTNSMVMCRLAQAHLARGNLREYVPFTLRAAELEQGNAVLQGQAGRIYMAMGQLERARIAADRIIRAQPDSLAGYLLMADAAQTAEDSRAALDKLMRKASQFSNEPLFHAAVGQLHLNLRNPAAAKASLNESLRLNPKLAQVHQALGFIHQMQGEMDKAAADFKAGAELAPNDPGVQLRMARFLLQTNDRKEARRVLEEVVNRYPLAGAAQVELARLDLMDRQHASALSRMDKLLALAPGHAEALVLRCRALMALNRAAEAVAALEGLVKSRPGLPVFRYELALAYVSDRKPTKAQEELDRVVTAAPGLMQARLLRAELAIRGGSANQALGDLRQVLQANPDSEQALQLTGAAYQALGQNAAAVENFRRLVRLTPNSAQSRYLLARALLSAGSTDEARSNLDSARKLDKDYQPVLYLLTAIDVREGHRDAALARVEGLLKESPDSATLLNLMGTILMDGKDYAAAERAFRRAIEIAPDTLNAYLMLSRLYVLTGKTQEALAEARRGIAAAPRNIAGLMLAAVLESGAGDTKAAAKHYEQALAMDNGFVPALNNLAYILADEKRNLDRAVELGMRARQIAPENPFVADTVGWVAYRRGDYPWAYAMIREGAEVLSASPEVLYHLGMAQAAVGREQEAADSLGKALSAKGTFSGRDEAAALLDVLKVNPDEAKDADRAAIETMLRSDRNNAPALYRLACMDERDGKLASARGRLLDSRKSNPHYLPAIVSLARISDRLGDHGKALELAREAQSKAGDDLDIKGMLGWLAYQGGQHEWAAGLLREVAASAPGNATVQYRYGLTQLALGRIEDARTFIGRALAKDPAFPDAGAAGRTLNLLALAEGNSLSQQDLEMAKAAVSEDAASVAGMYAMASILRRQGRKDASEEAMERLLAAYPNFAPAVVGLASSYLERGQKLDRAHALAAQARRLMPNNPLCGLILGKLAYKHGERDYAISLLKSAVTAFPDDAEAFYLLGLACDKAGNRQEASRALAKGLQLAPGSSYAAEAKKILERKN